MALAAALAILSVSCSRGAPGRASGPPPPPEPAPASLSMGPFQSVTGTSSMYASITESGRAKGGSSDSYGGGGGASRNLVFLDGTTLQSHQLFETNGQVVSDITPVGESAKPQSPTDANATKPVKWLMYRIVREDTDNDGRLDSRDLYSVGFSDAAGNDYADVLQHVESILGVSAATEGQLVLAYVVGGHGLASRVDIPTRTVLETREIVGFPIPSPK